MTKGKPAVLVSDAVAVLANGTPLHLARRFTRDEVVLKRDAAPGGGLAVDPEASDSLIIQVHAQSRLVR